MGENRSKCVLSYAWVWVIVKFRFFVYSFTLATFMAHRFKTLFPALGLLYDFLKSFMTT